MAYNSASNAAFGIGPATTVMSPNGMVPFRSTNPRRC